MMRMIRAFPIAVALFVSQAFCQTDSSDSQASEARKPRSWALSAEIGVNSLGSLIGPVATFYVKPRIPVDLGVGVSSTGLRPGLRARYLFSLDRVAYFAGLGLKYGMGTGDRDAELEDPGTKEKIKIQVDPSPFLDLSVGTEYLANNGFLVIANAGYSQLLGGKNYSVASGYTASDKAKKALDTVMGSGIMLSVSLGKAF